MLRQILSPSSPECGGEQVGASMSVDQLASSSSSSRGCYTNNVGALLTTNLDNNMRRDYTSPSFETVEMFSSGSSSYPCPTCGMEFVSRFKLNYHTRTHMERKFGCNVCSKSFTTQHHLKMHEAMHSDVKPFTCHTCPATFRYQKLLDRHRKMHDDPDVVKPYSCPRCFMRFDTRNNYNHHAKTHKSNALNPSNTDGERLNDNFNQVLPVSVTNSTSLSQASFPCEACSLEFPSIDSLNTHKLVHRSRPLVCDVCGKGFTHRKYYVVHQRIHTGERPYLCAMCGKSFTQASTLTVHRRYHTGERPYTCTQCGKGFVTRTIMLNHMKKH